MAANASDTRHKGGALSFMTNISEWVSVYRPSTTTTKLGGSDSSPSLIILLPWMNASNSHIAKYLRAYMEIYPSAQFLVVKSSLKHLVWQPSS
jgi:hypothetical protein